MQAPRLHAKISSAKAKTLSRHKQDCDITGRGKSCYDYGRGMWALGGKVNQKIARKYLVRGCELKYEAACVEYKRRAITTKVNRNYTKQRSSGAGSTGPCFSTADIDNSKLYPNYINKSSIRGQRISKIAKNSFWHHVGFKEGDVIVRVNNMRFNNTQEMLQVFATSGKKYSFEVERNHEEIVLWYTCN